MEPSGKVKVIEALSSRYLPPSGNAWALTETGESADEEGDEVNEVTGFADDASAADLGILSPVVEGNRPGVDAVMNMHGFRTVFVEIRKFLRKRGKATVKANSEQSAIRISQLFLNIFELPKSERQRLFHKNVPARFQGFDDQFRVGVVSGEDGDRVDVWVIEDLIFIGRCILEAKLFTGMLGMETTGGGDTNEVDIASLLYCWK
jgi:hypothetical protein